MNLTPEDIERIRSMNGFCVNHKSKTADGLCVNCPALLCAVCNAKHLSEMTSHEVYNYRVDACKMATKLIEMFNRKLSSKVTEQNNNAEIILQKIVKKFKMLIRNLERRMLETINNFKESYFNRENQESKKMYEKSKNEIESLLNNDIPIDLYLRCLEEVKKEDLRQKKLKEFNKVAAYGKLNKNFGDIVTQFLIDFAVIQEFIDGFIKKTKTPAENIVKGREIRKEQKPQEVVSTPHETIAEISQKEVDQLIVKLDAKIKNSVTKAYSDLAKSKEKKVDLHKKKIGGDGAKLVAYGLRQSNRVIVITLYGCNLTSGEAKLLGDGITNNNTLEELYLGAVYFWNEAWEKNLYSGFEYKENSGNQLGNEGTQIIAESIRQHKSLKILSLTYNMISSEAIPVLSYALSNNDKLEILYLYYNPIGYKPDTRDGFKAHLKIN